MNKDLENLEQLKHLLTFFIKKVETTKQIIIRMDNGNVISLTQTDMHYLIEADGHDARVLIKQIFGTDSSTGSWKVQK